MEEAKKYLLRKEVNPSYQRLKILEYLIKSHSHPTADTIYVDLIKEIPTLSKTTVYNTLNLFQERRIVLGLTIEENEIRYDSITKPHGHFKCTCCGAVFDISVECPCLTDDTVCEHKITERHLYLKGTCKNCLKKSGEHINS